MNDAQAWTLIGGFFAIFAAYNAMMLLLIRAKFDAVSARFDAVDVRLDHLDRDVQAIASRVFPKNAE